MLEPSRHVKYRRKFKAQLLDKLEDIEAFWNIPHYKKLAGVEQRLKYAISYILTSVYQVPFITEYRMSKTERIDIYIPSIDFGIELKLSSKLRSFKNQLQRYKKYIKNPYVVELDNPDSFKVLIKLLNTRLRHNKQTQAILFPVVGAITVVLLILGGLI